MYSNWALSEFKSLLKHCFNCNKKDDISYKRNKGKRVQTQHSESHQHIRKESKRIRNSELQKQPESNKIAITTYLSIITLNINGLNAPIKRWMDKEDVVQI